MVEVGGGKEEHHLPKKEGGINNKKSEVDISMFINKAVRS